MFVRGLTLEMGREKKKKQIPRCARNDNLQILRRVAEVWLWAAGRRQVVGLGLVAARRSAKSHPLRGELQRWVEARGGDGGVEAG